MLSEWKIDPHVIELEWSDEFFNLMRWNYLERRMYEMVAMKNAMNTKPGTEEVSEKEKAL